jgi:hypothetical protein
MKDMFLYCVGCYGTGKQYLPSNFKAAAKCSLCSGRGIPPIPLSDLQEPPYANDGHTTKSNIYRVRGI